MQRGRPFLKGESGNPAGRPKGVRNKATLVIEALMQGEGESITRACIEAAKAGDMTAARLILDRIAPAPRDRHVEVDLPMISSPADAPVAALALIDATAAGLLTPAEASAMMALLEGYRRASEVADLEARIAKLEARHA